MEYRCLWGTNYLRRDFGASITCHGVCTLNGADLRSSGPIEVFGTVSVENSNFNNGIIDEDIIIWDEANVTWTNSNGTGGDTDNWVRILSTRTIGVENGYVWFMGYEIGYDGTNTSQLRTTVHLILPKKETTPLILLKSDIESLNGETGMVSSIKKARVDWLFCQPSGAIIAKKLANYRELTTLM